LFNSRFIISGTQNPLVVLANQGIVFQTSQEAVKVPQDPNPGPDADPELSWMAGLESVEAVSYVSLAPGGQGGFTPNPQNPHYWHPKLGSSGECRRFAAIVAELARKNGDPAKFMQALKGGYQAPKNILRPATQI
jgi:hypothetical protein